MAPLLLHKPVSSQSPYGNRDSEGGGSGDVVVVVVVRVPSGGRNRVLGKSQQCHNNQVNDWS